MVKLKLSVCCSVDFWNNKKMFHILCFNFVSVGVKKLGRFCLKELFFAVLETLHSTTVSISQVFFVVIKARNLFGAMPVNKTPRLLALYGLFGSLHNFYFM